MILQHIIDVHIIYHVKLHKLKKAIFLILFLVITQHLFSKELSVIVEPVCEGEISQLRISDTINDFDQILWDLDNDGFFDDANGVIVEYIFNTAGQYPVNIKTLIDGIETIYTNIVTAQVLEKPNADFLVLNNCNGKSTVFRDNSTINGGSLSGYYWDFDNDGIFDSDNENDKFVFSESGEVIVTHKVISNENCASVISKSIEIFETPEANFRTENNCFGDSSQIINSSSIDNGQIELCLWKYGDGSQFLGTESHLHYYQEPGSYLITLIAISDQYCQDTLTHGITVFEQPDFLIEFSADTANLYYGQSLQVDIIGGPYNYIWENGENSIDRIISTSGYYNLIAETDNGCQKEFSFSLFFDDIPELKLQSTILTPNGDGINDIFVINNIEAYTHVGLKVINSLGQHVFYSNDYKNDWDLDNNNPVLNTGTYYYYIEIEGKISSGSLTILNN